MIRVKLNEKGPNFLPTTCFSAILMNLPVFLVCSSIQASEEVICDKVSDCSKNNEISRVL